MPSPSSGRRPSRRGRPPKYGRPAQVVAVTLPSEIVDALRRLHSDLGWAIVSLVEKSHTPRPRPVPPEAELVEIGDGHSLIVVNSDRFRSLPGVQIVPISSSQSFLALEPGRGMADLELAVADRVERLPAAHEERRALERLRRQLRRWRRTRSLHFHNRVIILVTPAPMA